MRFLVDANLSPRVAARLRLEGHDVEHVEHVGDVGLLTAEDGPILAHLRVRPLPMGKRTEGAEREEEETRDPAVRALPDPPE